MGQIARILCRQINYRCGDTINHGYFFCTERTHVRTDQRDQLLANSNRRGCGSLNHMATSK